MAARSKLKTKKEKAKVREIKEYGDPCTLSFIDCGVCLVQGITTVPLDKKEESYWTSPTGGVVLSAEQGVLLAEQKSKSKIYNYNSPESFNFEEKLFNDIKEYGFNSMHKYIR